MLRLTPGLCLTLCAIAICAAEESFDSNGVCIHFSDEGAGEPVVLLHGAFGSGADWAKWGVTEALTAGGFRAVAPDMRGFGKSGKPHDPTKYGLEMSTDVARLMDHLNIEKAHVVGYSQGAIVRKSISGQTCGSLVIGHPRR